MWCGRLKRLEDREWDISDLTPHAREDPQALRTKPFQEGEDDEDILGDWHARMTYDM
jgi:hypothetical protein